MSTIKEAKQQATRLLSRLSELGVSLKRAQALEGIAAINNYSDWNRYSASLQPNELAVTATSSLPPATATYIHDLAITVLAMRAGTGKSIILRHCLADALSRTGATSILIHHGGYGTKEIPPSILSQCTIINVAINNDGVVLPEPDGALKRVVIYNLNLEARFGERGKPLGTVFTKLISCLPDAFLNELCYFLVDDCDRDGWDTLSAEIEDTYRNLRKRGGAKIVVSCQALPSVDELPSTPTSVISDSGTIDYQPFKRILAGYTAPLQFHLADDFDSTVDLGDQNIMVKNIAKFALRNIHKHRTEPPERSSISPSIAGGEKLSYFELTSREIFSTVKNL